MTNTIIVAKSGEILLIYLAHFRVRQYEHGW